jgi:ornithine--oxo-acid transaminase
VVISLMRDHKILVQVGGPGVNIIKLLPPLIIGDEEVNRIVTAFDAVLSESTSIQGQVWSTSTELIKAALGR